MSTHVVTTTDLLNDMKLVNDMAQEGILIHLIRLAAQKRSGGSSYIIDDKKLEQLKKATIASTREVVRRRLGKIRVADYYENHACIMISQLFDAVDDCDDLDD